MIWNLSSECSSLIVLFIIWVYSRRHNPLPTMKNKIFQSCFLISALAMISNILSTLMLYEYQHIPLILTWLVTSIYFLATPLMGTVYYFYTVAVLYENQQLAKKIMIISAIPAILYGFLVLLNPWTHQLFTISEQVGYIRGDFVNVTYLVFILYTFAVLLLILFAKTSIEKGIRRILTSFPVVASLVVLFQFINPSYILTGTAATCSLLVIYLYLQNKQLSLDYLTGIPNRKELLNFLNYKIENQEKKEFTFLVVSIKGFKHINNKFNQQQGDELLLSISKYLNKLSKKLSLYRFSGDEFALIIHGYEPKLIEEIGKKILERFQSPWEINGYLINVSAVIGVISYPTTASTLDEIVTGVEFAIVKAKQNMDQLYSVCTSEMLEELSRRRQITEILKDYIVRDAFEVYYQPIVSTKTGKFLVAESLLRMNDTSLGRINPCEFIPLAEDSFLIADMTYLVLHKICRFIQEMLDEHIEVDCITINFSAIQFQEQNLHAKVKKIIDQYQIPYSKIKIEITESLLATDFEKVDTFIRSMNELGVRFALDDFGTGYSNLSSVMITPLDTIKLDKSIIYFSLSDKNTEKLLKSICHGFREAGLDILAEGIETKEQSKSMLANGVDLIQGFYYAKPMPEGEAKTYFGKQVEIIK